MTKDFDPSPWFPETEPVKIAALGKALEEIFELAPLLAFPPPRGKTTAPDYWQHLSEELADVEATLTLVVQHYGLDLSDCVADPQSSAHQQILLDLGKAISRVLIQGIDELEPRTGESNRAILAQHVWGTRVMIMALTSSPLVDSDFVKERAERKAAYLSKWHENMQASLDAEEHDRKLDAWGDAFDRDRAD